MGLKHAHEILNVENAFNISSTFILDCQFSQRRSNFAGPKLSDFPVCYNLLKVSLLSLPAQSSTASLIHAKASLDRGSMRDELVEMADTAILKKKTANF